jgi:cyclin C
MSANYWTSSQYTNWLLTKSQLDQSRLKTLQKITDKELMKLDLYYTSVIHKLARSIASVVKLPIRQQTIATAIVFYKRFYTKNDIVEVDPLLICATCFFVASKAEECPIHIKTLVNEMKHLYGSQFPFDASFISEFEFYLLQDLDYYTVVYHPYHTLNICIQHLKLGKTVLQSAR